MALLTLLATGPMLAPTAASGQADYSTRYRPGTDYRQIEVDRFEIIYPAGTDTTAALFRNAFQRSFAEARSIVGTDTEDFHLPVVVDPNSDIANGLVTSRNFRAVLFTPHPTNAFGTYYESWAETVVPHELVHALHYEMDSGVGVGGALDLFSGDLSRFINGLAPGGWAEGIAVYRESQVRPKAGRLDAPLFTMKYRASLTSGDPWSLGEVMYESIYERPNNRHYLGGGQLIEHMAQERGDTDFFRRATRWHHRLPFLGFGMAFWMGTGQTPAQASDAFLEEERQKERERLDSLRRAAEDGITDPSVLAGKDGLYVRRPYWLSDSTLVAYASGYATRPGFYRFDAAEGQREAISYQAITPGRSYAIGPDTTALYFSRSHADALVKGRTVYRAHRLDLHAGEVTSTSKAGGVFSPARQAGGPVWAARRDGSSSELVTLTANGADVKASRPGLRLKQVAPSPSGDTVAVLANAGGKQGLYYLGPSGSTLEPWVRFKDGTIYDVSWGPEGRYVLFSGDPSGIANVYVLDRHDGEVRRLTTVRYGALGPALSPGRKRVAFARYQHERFELSTIPFRPEGGRPVAEVEWNWAPDDGALTAAVSSGAGQKAGGRRASGVTSAAPGASGSDLDVASLRDQSRPYAAWRHLLPRSVFPALPSGTEDVGPTVRGEDLGTGIGLRLSGADPLRRWAYSATGFYQAGRLWGKLTAETGLVPSTPSVTAFNRPFETTTPSTRRGDPRLEAYEERGLGLAAEQTLFVRKNVFTTSVSVGLEGQFRQVRPITAQSEPEGDFSNRFTIRPRLTAKYRVQQNIRDLVPNTGLVSTTKVEADVSVPSDVSPSRFLTQRLDAYWPLLSSVNGGLRTSALFLTQSQGSLFDAQSLVPRGYRDVAAAQPRAGNYLRLDMKYTQPFWYVDTGSVMLPVAIDALYGYGLGQAQYRVDGSASTTFQERRASVSVGLGVSFRPLGKGSVRLEVGASRRLDVGASASAWSPHVRTALVL